MSWIFNKSFNWFELICIISIGSLLQVSWWWIFLVFPVTILNIVGESYFEQKEGKK